MPNQSLITHITGYSVDVGVDTGFSEVCGFVVAPFSHGFMTPRLLITAEDVCMYQTIQDVPHATAHIVNSVCAANALDGSSLSPSHRNYIDDYERFHAQLQSDRFAKIVLSRLMTVRPEYPDNGPIYKSPFELFSEACERYPRMFVCLFTTPDSGTWLIATPELLIDCVEGRCHTMALAGTMPWSENCQSKWKQKDKDEQQIVADYIRDVLSQYTEDLRISKQYTARAAGLAHLRNDFEFTIADSQLGEVVNALFPTPAVCGLPKDETYQFILDNEYSDRRYYSGYCGPVNIDGTTSLFVSLRCMSINKDGYDIYAGGGLLADSREPDEWRETVAKMQTMLSLIGDDDSGSSDD